MLFVAFDFFVWLVIIAVLALLYRRFARVKALGRLARDLSKLP